MGRLALVVALWERRTDVCQFASLGLSVPARHVCLAAAGFCLSPQIAELGLETSRKERHSNLGGYGSSIHFKDWMAGQAVSWQPVSDQGGVPGVVLNLF